MVELLAALFENEAGSESQLGYMIRLVDEQRRADAANNGSTWSNRLPRQRKSTDRHAFVQA